MPGCDEGDCGAVLASKWSKVFDVPVGALGAAAYGLLILLAARPLPARERGPRLAATTLVALIPAAALWFVFVQAKILRAFCPWCTATHLLASAGAILLAWSWHRDAPRRPSSASAPGARRDTLPPGVWRPALAAAASILGLVILGQVASPEAPPPRTLSATMAPPPAATPASASAPLASSTSASPAPGATGAETPKSPPGVLSLHGGRFQLDPRQVPIIGSPDAPHRMVMLSDYTCRYCRAAHRLLHAVRQDFSTNEFAILMLPSQHGGESLEIQQLMLATWRLDPGLWLQVADDLYEERLALVPATVRSTLEANLGPERLTAALLASQAWTRDLFQLSRGIYTANSEKAGSRSIPQFILGQEIIVGAPSDAAEFYQLLAQHLGLVRSRLPELQLATTEVNLGRVFAGTLQSFRLPFSNPGKAPVQVDRATVGPGGRFGAGFRVPVPPGQTSSLDLAIPVPRDPGPFEQTIALFSNARTPSNAVRVVGTSWKPLTITPEVLDFGRLDADHTSTQGVMRLELAEPVTLDSVRSENPGFTARLDEVAAGRLYDITVATSPELAAGRQQAMLLVELGKPAPPGWPERLALAARAVVERAVTVVPARILLPAGTLASDRHHQVLVRSTDDPGNFSVTDAVLEGGPAFAQPQIQQGGRPGEFIVVVTLPSGWALPPAPGRSHLVIHTSHPKYSRLEVPLVTQGP